METGQMLRNLMRERQLTQADVAKHARVSQASVSRVLRRKEPQRSGAAYLRIYSYIQSQHENEQQPLEVFAAVRRVWDGSERHAAALRELIESSQRLWPDLAKAEE
jgi:transcriptional regulator with XRE-family HTH domain